MNYVTLEKITFLEDTQHGGKTLAIMSYTIYLLPVDRKCTLSTLKIEYNVVHFRILFQCNGIK